MDLGFIGFQHAAWLALHLNRTLILPPITSNKHDHQYTFQKWSTYFDLPRFEQLTGVRVKEWSDIRSLTEKEIAIGIEKAHRVHSHQPIFEWEALAENITCQVTKDFNILNGVAEIFSDLFLLRVSFVDPPLPQSHRGVPANAMTTTTSSSSSNATNAGSSSASASAAARSMVNLSDIRDRYQDWEESTIYFSHTFSLKGSSKIRPFDELGRYIYFTSEIEDVAHQMVQALNNPTEAAPPLSSPSSATAAAAASTSASASLSSSSSSQAPASPSLASPTESPAPASSSPSMNATTRPYIAVHFRRDDIIDKCIDKHTHVAFIPLETCLPPMKRWVAMVERARQRIQRRTSIEPLVVVMTDTTSEQDLKAIEDNGWHRMDHVKAGTKARLGVFGAAMVDAAILTNADEMVGTRVSTMSAIAQARRKSWFGSDTLYP
ncbi:hypothetical protein EC968_004884 [Mortierella alpina]|nr:hypothetical protein EC968_004884 [Mortierella alpina]